MGVSEDRIREIVREEIEQYVAVGYTRPNIYNPIGRYEPVGTLMSLKELKRRESEEFSEATV